jgi:hypothetical protein
MKFFKWNACHYKQDILNQIDLIRPRTGNILVKYKHSKNHVANFTSAKTYSILPTSFEIDQIQNILDIGN